MSRWEIYRAESPDEPYSVLALNPESAVLTARRERFGFVAWAMRWRCCGDDWRSARSK